MMTFMMMKMIVVMMVMMTTTTTKDDDDDTKQTFFFQIDTTLPETRRKWASENLPINRLVQLMSYRFKSEECGEIRKILNFSFPDTKSTVSFQIRNGLVDFVNIFEQENSVISVTVNESTWRGLVGGRRSGLWAIATGDITVEPSLVEFGQIMMCFEK